MNAIILVFLSLFAQETYIDLVRIWQNKPQETPAKFMEVVYHDGNTYLKLESGEQYEPYISFRKPNREIFQLGVQLGGAGDDFVLYSLPMKGIVYRISPQGDMKLNGTLAMNNTGRLQGLVVKGDSLFIWVDGRKFAMKEVK